MHAKETDMKSQYVVSWSDCAIGPFKSKRDAQSHVRKQFPSAAEMRDDLSWSIKPLEAPQE
jgi:coenzyme F420-reducing hydrogenase gamma subunit